MLTGIAGVLGIVFAGGPPTPELETVVPMSMASVAGSTRRDAMAASSYRLVQGEEWEVYYMLMDVDGSAQGLEKEDPQLLRTTMRSAAEKRVRLGEYRQEYTDAMNELNAATAGPPLAKKQN